MISGICCVQILLPRLYKNVAICSDIYVYFLSCFIQVEQRVFLQLLINKLILVNFITLYGSVTRTILLVTGGSYCKFVILKY